MHRGLSRLAAELDDLPLQIHEAALESERWHGVLGSIVQLVGGRTANLMLLQNDSLAPTLYISRNIDPAAEHLYQTHWHQHDLWLRIGAGFSAKSIIVGQQIVSDETLFASEFYNDFLRHQDVGQVLTNLFEKNNTMWGHVSVHRAARDDEFAAFEREVMRVLIPHLATAVAVHVRLSGLEDRIRATEAALDRLPVGICLIDQTGKTTYRNRMAQEILIANDGFSVRSGSLCAAASNDNRELAAQVAAAVATGLGRAACPGGMLSVSRPSMRRPYSVLVAPLTHARDSTNGIIGETRPCVIVLIIDLEREPYYPREFLARRHQLTAAEARLACEIVLGRSLQDAADTFGVTIGTVRNHLKQIFAKTDVKRQSELVRLLTSDLAARAARLASDQTFT